MSIRSEADLQHVFESLRKGLVPQRGLDAFAVGIDKERGEMARQLDMAASGEGSIKLLRGDYGCGKTFVSRLTLQDAIERGFATSFVVVSDNDTRLYKFEELYARIVSNLSTSTCPQGALGDVLDRWVGSVEEALEDTGSDPDDEGFDALVLERLEQDLHARTQGQAPQDFIRVVKTIFELKQRGELTEAGALLSWLAGSRNVSASAKRAAGVRGEITSRDALAYLRGVLAIVRAAGHTGLVVVVDETETLLRSRRDTRGRSLNGLRQIADAAGSYPGLLWVLTGTPDFFDSRRGVAGLPPLHDRVRFMERGGFASMRQPQLRLRPFDKQRLFKVAHKLHKLYPAAERERVDERVTEGFIERLVDEVSHGFGQDVGVVPRQFLREFINVLDMVDEEEEFVPAQVYEFELDESSLRDEERDITYQTSDDEPEELLPVEDVW